MEESKETKKILRDEIVAVKPNFANPGWIKNPKHRAFFLMEGCFKSYSAPLKKNGIIANVLTNEEKEFFEEYLHMEKNALSVYNKPDDNFWTTFDVRLTKDTLHLDLSDPYDYIKYKILLANKDHIAPSIGDRKKKATYKFYIETKSDVANLSAKQADLNTKVWTEMGKIFPHKDKIVDLIRVYAESYPTKYGKFKSVSEDNKLDFLRGQLGDIVSGDMELFLEIINDPRLETKVLISKALKKGILERKGTKYHLSGDPHPFAKDFKSACDYLASDVNQEFKLTIEEKLKLDE